MERTFRYHTIRGPVRVLKTLQALIVLAGLLTACLITWAGYQPEAGFSVNGESSQWLFTFHGIPGTDLSLPVPYRILQHTRDAFSAKTAVIGYLWMTWLLALPFGIRGVTALRRMFQGRPHAGSAF